MGAFWENKCQSGRIATIWKFGEVKYHIWNFEGKNVNEWIIQGDKI